MSELAEEWISTGGFSALTAFDLMEPERQEIAEPAYRQTLAAAGFFSFFGIVVTVLFISLSVSFSHPMLLLAAVVMLASVVCVLVYTEHNMSRHIAADWEQHDGAS